MFDEVKTQFLKKYKESDFLNGGCYCYALAVTQKYGGTVYINRLLEHCAVMFEGNLYDIRGRIRDTSGFRPIKDWEIKMCEKEYILRG